jgi:rod shape-determining protein MreC
MERLFLFIYQYRAFFTFVTLEIFCAWLIIENNRYQGAQFFNSSNGFVASVNNFSQGVREYFSLREINTTLAQENAILRSKLEVKTQAGATSGIVTDSAVIKRFEFVSAKVVNNSVDRSTNFLTINRGSEDGVKHNMAVISPLGAVGKVKVTSAHYSVVMSILNIDMMVSATIKRTGHFGTIQWDGRNSEIVSLKYIPPHVKVMKGDTIVTSGYNAVFPEDIMIGVIQDVRTSDAALFHDIDVKLVQDFGKLSFVTVIRSTMKQEQDSLEQLVTPVQK